jgi:hypothetical protein
VHRLFDRTKSFIQPWLGGWVGGQKLKEGKEKGKQKRGKVKRMKL